jgi:hypothetical protein
MSSSCRVEVEMASVAKDREKPWRAIRSVPLPWGLLGMLALAGAIETQVAGSADRLAGYEGLAVRFALDAARREAPRCDVLSLGDSVVKFGFDPAEIEARTGLKAYNLAVPGTPPPLTYALFRRALDAGAKPKVLVIGQMSLGGDPWANVSQFGEFVGIGEAWSLAWSCRDCSLFGAMITSRLIPSLRYRYQIRAGLRGDPVPDANNFLDTWNAGHGAELRPPRDASQSSTEQDRDANRFSQPWQVHGIYEQYFEKLVKLALSRGIAVYWLIPPMLPEVQTRRDALGLDDRHTGNLRTIHSWLPGVVVLDARHSGYPATDFFDPIHLNARGAARLSAEIAGVIARRRTEQGGPLWVNLPRPDGSAPQIATGRPRSQPESIQR